MNTFNHAVAKDVVPPAAQPAHPAPSDELTDEDLEVVVGGLGRPWTALPLPE